MGKNTAICGPDDNWRARMDLDTMIQAKLIEKDPTRLSAVHKVAKEVAAENVDRAKASLAVAKMKAVAKAKSKR